MTLDEISDYIGELHGATKPAGVFAIALETDKEYEVSPFMDKFAALRSYWLHEITVRALRNQGQPYYDAR